MALSDFWLTLNDLFAEQDNVPYFARCQGDGSGAASGHGTSGKDGDAGRGCGSGGSLRTAGYKDGSGSSEWFGISAEDIVTYGDGYGCYQGQGSADGTGSGTGKGLGGGNKHGVGKERKYG